VHALTYGVTDEARLWEVAARAGIDADGAEHRFLHRMVVTGGVPTPAGGGLAGRPAVDASGSARVFLAGDWVGPEGLLA
ncbi:hypothetical protein ABTM13_20320, partial [Acinetobacter baumannii]